MIEFLSRLRLQRYGKIRNWQNFWTDFYVIKHILFSICLITHILKNQKSLCSKQGKNCNKAKMPQKVTHQHLRTTEQTPSPLATTTLPSLGKNFISSRHITPVPLSTLLQNKRDQPRKPRQSAQPTHYYKQNSLAAQPRSCICARRCQKQQPQAATSHNFLRYAPRQSRIFGQT